MTKLTVVQQLNHYKSGDSGKKKNPLSDSSTSSHSADWRLLRRYCAGSEKAPVITGFQALQQHSHKTSLSQRQTLRRRLCSNVKRALTVCLIRNLWRRQTRSFRRRGETWVSSSEDSAHVDHTSPLIPPPVQLSKRNTLESPCYLWSKPLV